MYSEIATLIHLQGETRFTCDELHRLFPKNKKHADIVRHLKREYGIKHQAIIVKGKAVGYIFNRDYVGKVELLWDTNLDLMHEINLCNSENEKLIKSNDYMSVGLLVAISTLFGLLLLSFVL